MQEFNFKSKELYINLSPKDIPPKGHPDFQALIEWEEAKCKGGVNIGGVFFPGSLYFKTNHLFLDLDELDEYDNITTKLKRFELRDIDWIIHNTYYLADKEKIKELFALISSRQIGKFLADYEPVITIDGEVPIGQIKVGDVVYGKDGQPTNVIAVYPQGVKPIYKMTLMDGRTIDCGLDHLWEVQTKNKGKIQVISTEEIMNRMSKYNPFYLPQCKPVKFPSKSYFIDPYVLGYFIGDAGLMKSINFSFTPEDINFIVPKIQSKLSKDYKYTQTDKHRFYISNCKDLKDEIKRLELNVRGDYKFIPKEYLLGDVEQRKELLKGLLDSDGGCYYHSKSNSSSITYTTTSKKLSDDIQYLINSLGISCSVHSRQRYRKGNLCKVSYEIILRTIEKVFSLDRKNNKIISTKRKDDSKIRIKSIEYLTDCSATCITVDNKDHLYLTRNFIPTHNTVDLAVLLLYSLQFFPKTNALLLADDKGAVGNVTRYLTAMLNTMTDFLKIPLLDKDFNQPEVRFGYKEVDNTDIVWNTLFIRNTQGGTKTEVSAGTTIRFAALDEIGRYNFSESLSALMPALRGKFGLKGVPYLVGTGGSFEKGKDAQRHFLKPSILGIKAFTQPDGVDTGLFLTQNYRQEAKNEVNLKKFLQTTDDKLLLSVTTGKPNNKPSELDDLKIWVKDDKLAEEIYTRELSSLLESNENIEALKYQAYYPKEYTDIFLSKSGNRFYREGLENHKKWLENEYTPQYVDLYKDNTGEIKFKISDKVPITTFPTPPDSLFKDCPVVIYDHPRYKDKYRAYKTEVSGIDTYFSDDTSTSDSLGSIYVMRRTNSNIDDQFHETMVASFTSRPKTLNEFNKTVELILEYYGCTVLNEVSGSFTQYFDTRKKGHYLEDVIQLQREINPKTKAMNSKGMAANVANKRFRYDLVEAYLDEETKDGLPGYTRIKDPMLIAELLAYNPENKKFNGDRIDGFSYALVHLFKEKKYSPMAMLYEQELEPKKIDFSRNMFGESKSFSTFDMKRTII